MFFLSSSLPLRYSNVMLRKVTGKQEMSAHTLDDTIRPHLCVGGRVGVPHYLRVSTAFFRSRAMPPHATYQAARICTRLPERSFRNRIERTPSLPHHHDYLDTHHDYQYTTMTIKTPCISIHHDYHDTTVTTNTPP